MSSMALRLGLRGAAKAVARACARRPMSTAAPTSVKLRVAVVGAGPAGFYTARTILKKLESAEVDIIEMLPTPFGLVRYGVAPDHAETKNVTTEFGQILDMPGCNFVGNVTVGKDVQIPELRSMYHAVVMCYGASGDSALGIPGEGLEGSMSARAFVNWYNGHPHYAKLKLDLSAGTRAAVVGNGNVAIDVARILLRPVHELAKTDIAEYACGALYNSRIEEVDIIARRGPVQAAWTTAELREIVTMNCQVSMRDEEMSLEQADLDYVALNRARKRMMSLLDQTHRNPKQSSGTAEAQKRLNLRFLLSPTEVIGENGRVSSLKLEKNVLSGPVESRKAQGTGVFEDMPCSLLLRSVGYKSKAISGVPFNPKTSTVPNSVGMVLSSPDGECEVGLYVSGWLKRGPSGIIGTNIACGQVTAMSILDDWNAKRISGGGGEKKGRGALQALLSERGATVVDLEGWRRIDRAEQEMGQKNPALVRPRVKITSIDEMLSVAQRP